MKRVCLLLILVVSLAYIHAQTDIVPCNSLLLRGNGCTDLVCGSFAVFQDVFASEIPSNANSGRFVPQPPSDPSKLLTFTLYNISGEYDNPRVTEIGLSVDDRNGGGGPRAIGIRIGYDWTGDGVYDRYEYLVPFQLDQTAGFETITLFASGSSLSQTTGTGYQPLSSSVLGRGNVQLTLWSAYNTTGAINVRTNGPSYVKIPYRNTRASPLGVGITGPGCQTPPNFPTTGTCNCVAFKIIQVGDFYLHEIVQDILNVFRNESKTAVSVGIIGNDFGSNAPFVQFIRDANADPTWEVEIASNGYTFTSWANYSAAQVANDLNSFNNMLFNVYRISARTVFVPGDVPNQYTADGLQLATGWTHMSALRTQDPGPYAITHSPVYRFNHDTSTQLTSQRTYMDYANSINTWINTDGFSVVSLNPTDFRATDTTSDPAMIQKLSQLIREVKARGKNIVPVSRINLDNTPIPRILVKNCNCVAFRLDDIQDFFVSAAQTAVIDIFREFQLPITLGVIGGKFGSDSSVVTHVLDDLALSQSSNCFKVEIANHGWQHEDFSAISSAASQAALMANTNSQIRSTLGTGVTVRTFVPPFNTFNAQTITAAINSGFTHFSSQTQLDQGPFNYDNPTIWRFPVGAFTNDINIPNYFRPISADQTYNDIISQRARYGFASVMMHPMEFSNGFNNGTYLNEVNTTQINQLRTLLQRVKNSGMRAVLIGDIEKWFDPTYGNACYGPATSTSGTSTSATATTTTTTSSSATSTTTTTTTSGTSTSTSTTAAVTSTSTSGTPSTSAGTTSAATSTATSAGTTSAGTSTSTTAASTTAAASTTGTTIDVESFGVRAEVLLTLVLLSILLVLQL